MHEAKDANVYPSKFCTSVGDGFLNSNKTTVSDLVQISPDDFQKSSAEAIEDNINAKYANKVYFLC